MPVLFVQLVANVGLLDVLCCTLELFSINCANDCAALANVLLIVRHHVHVGCTSSDAVQLHYSDVVSMFQYQINNN